MGVRGRKYAAVSALEFGTGEARLRLRRRAAARGLHGARAPERGRGSKPNAARVIALLATGAQGGDPHGAARISPRDCTRSSGTSGCASRSPRARSSPSARSRRPPQAAAIREGNRCSAAGIAAAERHAAGLPDPRKPPPPPGKRPHERAPQGRDRGRVHRGGLRSPPPPSPPAATRPATRTTGARARCARTSSSSWTSSRGSRATGFYGDMTRTFLRGRASDAQRAIVAAVRAAQKAALRTIRAGRERDGGPPQGVRDLRRPRASRPGARPAAPSASSTARATASASRSTSPRG